LTTATNPFYSSTTAFAYYLCLFQDPELISQALASHYLVIIVTGILFLVLKQAKRQRCTIAIHTGKGRLYQSMHLSPVFMRLGKWR
jgi:hypothetical protein